MTPCSAIPRWRPVIVAIAVQFHVDSAIRALKAGKHALVEKPLGTTISDCERLAAEVRDSGLVAQVGTMKRFAPGIRDAQRFLAEEGGEILALKAWYCDSICGYVETDNSLPVMATSAAIRRRTIDSCHSWGSPRSDYFEDGIRSLAQGRSLPRAQRFSYAALTRA